MRRRVGLIALVLMTLVWSIALMTAPAAAAPRLSALTYASGSLICHQQPARSFHWGAAQFPVCARCLGLYLGAVAGALAWTAIGGLGSKPSPRAERLVSGLALRRALVAVAAPTLASVGLAWLGLWDGTNVVRAALALPLGAVIAAIAAAVSAGDLR